MTIYKKIRNQLFGPLSIDLAIIWPSRFYIWMMRRYNRIQLSIQQLQLILLTIKKRRPCKLFVFGLGNDSLLWSKLNQGGKTVFLEDNKVWLDKVTKKLKRIEAFHVDYNTRREDWKKFLESPSLLEMTLPNNLEKKEWDVVLVDAPAGKDDNSPGRMKSIFLSSRLINNSGDVFVHDCNREIEDIYSNHFLKKENLRSEIKASVGILRHYNIINHIT